MKVAACDESGGLFPARRQSADIGAKTGRPLVRIGRGLGSGWSTMGQLLD